MNPFSSSVNKVSKLNDTAYELFSKLSPIEKNDFRQGLSINVIDRLCSSVYKIDRQVFFTVIQLIQSERIKNSVSAFKNEYVSDNNMVIDINAGAGVSATGLAVNKEGRLAISAIADQVKELSASFSTATATDNIPYTAGPNIPKVFQVNTIPLQIVNNIKHSEIKSEDYLNYSNVVDALAASAPKAVHPVVAKQNDKFLFCPAKVNSDINEDKALEQIEFFEKVVHPKSALRVFIEEKFDYGVRIPRGVSNMVRLLSDVKVPPDVTHLFVNSSDRNLVCALGNKFPDKHIVAIGEMYGQHKTFTLLTKTQFHKYTRAKFRHIVEGKPIGKKLKKANTFVTMIIDPTRAGHPIVKDKSRKTLALQKYQDTMINFDEYNYYFRYRSCFTVEGVKVRFTPYLRSGYFIDDGSGDCVPNPVGCYAKTIITSYLFPWTWKPFCFIFSCQKPSGVFSSIVSAKDIEFFDKIDQGALGVEIYDNMILEEKKNEEDNNPFQARMARRVVKKKSSRSNSKLSNSSKSSRTQAKEKEKESDDESESDSGSDNDVSDNDQSVKLVNRKTSSSQSSSVSNKVYNDIDLNNIKFDA